MYVSVAKQHKWDIVHTATLYYVCSCVQVLTTRTFLDILLHLNVCDSLSLCAQVCVCVQKMYMLHLFVYPANNT